MWLHNESEHSEEDTIKYLSVSGYFGRKGPGRTCPFPTNNAYYLTRITAESTIAKDELQAYDVSLPAVQQARLFPFKTLMSALG